MEAEIDRRKVSQLEQYQNEPDIVSLEERSLALEDYNLKLTRQVEKLKYQFFDEDKLRDEEQLERYIRDQKKENELLENQLAEAKENFDNVNKLQRQEIMQLEFIIQMELSAHDRCKKRNESLRYEVADLKAKLEILKKQRIKNRQKIPGM